MDKCQEELNLSTVMDYIRDLATNFYERAKDSKSEIIRNLCTYPYNPRCRYRRPRDFLYGNKVHGAYRTPKSEQQYRTQYFKRISKPKNQKK